ncbi:MAG TPA: molybdopterin-dependent oxidoreductase [Thermoanaerobaculia bacterium]|nr:molybdopterin-dependent oxidoreductase [Thermoanaerobaculia bacterium]
MPTAATTCPMDCPDACALTAEIADGRVTALGGAADHPVTAGFICAKVAGFHRRLDHPDRLLYPARRVGAKGAGRFERISWDEAIAEITERFRGIAARWGAEAILPFHYGGSNGLLSDDLLDALYFDRLGATRLAKTICAAPSTAVARGMYGRMPGVAPQDYAEARAILVWGANPKASSIHLVPFLREARRRGAWVAAVDPQRNFTDREADEVLQILPGADLPVALAMIRRWHEQGLLDREFLAAHAVGTEALLAAADAWDLPRAAAEAGVAADAIARLADRWAAASPAVVRTGWGLERNRNGGQALAAILAMPALLGKFGVRGGGYTMSNSAFAKLATSEVLGPLDTGRRQASMTRLGAWLVPEGAEPDREDPSWPPRPPVQALFVYNANPAATVPDQNRVLAGLAREDLYTVVFEQVMTDTARWADLLLPAAMFPEQWEIVKGYGTYTVGGVPPLVAPAGEARPNVEVFAALGRAAGFRDEPFGWDERQAFERVAAALTLAGAPADRDRLAAGLWQLPEFDGHGPGAGPIQLTDVFPATADGRIHLVPPELGDEPFAYHPVRSRDARHPLTLISPASARRISSTLGELGGDEVTAALHPDDAAARGIVAGALVRVHNELGEVICRARVSDRVRPGVVSIPKGSWRRDSANGAAATALCPSHLNRVGAGACFNDARVEVALAVPTRADGAAGAAAANAAKGAAGGGLAGA